jgi:hypothetical protein
MNTQGTGLKMQNQRSPVMRALPLPTGWVSIQFHAGGKKQPSENQNSASIQIVRLFPTSVFFEARPETLILL